MSIRAAIELLGEGTTLVKLTMLGDTNAAADLNSRLVAAIEQLRLPATVPITLDDAGRAAVRQWLIERLENCQRIAATKTGRDRDGWLADSGYLNAALQMIADRP